MVDKPIDPDLNICSLLPIRSMVITLEAVGESYQRFFHQHALNAYLRFSCESPKTMPDTYVLMYPRVGPRAVFRR